MYIHIYIKDTPTQHIYIKVVKGLMGNKSQVELNVSAQMREKTQAWERLEGNKD